MHTYLASVAAYVQVGGSSASQRPVGAREQRQGETRAHAARSTVPEQGVVVSISDEALQAAKERALADLTSDVRVRGARPQPEDHEEQSFRAEPQTEDELSAEERQELADLRQRDITVRTRDMAYVAATAGVSGGFTVRYQTGPDGRRYAVEANVQFDTSEAATPEQSLAKARALRAALMSASGDAAKDASATTRAAALEDRARAELARAQRESERIAEDGPELALPEVELQGVEG